MRKIFFSFLSVWAGRKYKERAGCGMEDAWGLQKSENNSRESWEKSESRQIREMKARYGDSCGERKAVKAE